MNLDGYDAGSVALYFLGHSDGERIKVGITTRPGEARRLEHENAGPDELDLTHLATVLCSPSDEKIVKRTFKHLRVHGRTQEWFYAKPELVDYVRWLLHQWYVTDVESKSVGLTRVHSDMWLPNPDRVFVLPEEELPINTWGHLTRGPVTGDDFYTHPSIIAAARDVLGRITLDPASHPSANEVVRAETIFTIADNGLTADWGGRVWCNPPFGQWELWAKKIAAEWQSGRVEAMCLLAASRTITAKCMAPVHTSAAAMTVLHGRIPFWGPKATSSPDDGHLIFYFGPDVDLFVKAFESLGNVYTLTAGYAGRRHPTAAAESLAPP